MRPSSSCRWAGPLTAVKAAGLRPVLLINLPSVQLQQQHCCMLAYVSQLVGVSQ
jgi:hypothetical protein